LFATLLMRSGVRRASCLARLGMEGWRCRRSTAGEIARREASGKKFDSWVVFCCCFWCCCCWFDCDSGCGCGCLCMSSYAFKVAQNPSESGRLPPLLSPMRQTRALLLAALSSIRLSHVRRVPRDEDAGDCGASGGLTMVKAVVGMEQAILQR